MKTFYMCLAGVFALISSCKSDFDAPCRNQTVNRKITFSAAEKAAFPFTGKDTIGFVSGTADTILFYADSLYTLQDFKTSVVKGNPECPPDVDSYEGVTALYKSAASFDYRVTFRKSNDSCLFTIANSSVAFPIRFIGDSTLIFKDSVSFPGRTFYKVNTILTNDGDSLMVNSSNGVVYFTAGGKSYYQYKFNRK